MAEQLFNIDDTLLEEIIDEWAKESGKHIDLVINDIARYYKMDEKNIVESLKAIDSKFTNGTNRIIGYIDGHPVKRTTYHMNCIRVFKKVISGLKNVETFEASDQSHINFLTETMYQYLRGTV